MNACMEIARAAGWRLAAAARELRGDVGRPRRISGRRRRPGGRHRRRVHLPFAGVGVEAGGRDHLRRPQSAAIAHRRQLLLRPRCPLHVQHRSRRRARQLRQRSRSADLREVRQEQRRWMRPAARERSRRRRHILRADRTGLLHEQRDQGVRRAAQRSVLLRRRRLDRAVEHLRGAGPEWRPRLGVPAGRQPAAARLVCEPQRVRDRLRNGSRRRGAEGRAAGLRPKLRVWSTTGRLAG